MLLLGQPVASISKTCDGKLLGRRVFLFPKTTIWGRKNTPPDKLKDIGINKKSTLNSRLLLTRIARVVNPISQTKKITMQLILHALHTAIKGSSFGWNAGSWTKIHSKSQRTVQQFPPTEPLACSSCQPASRPSSDFCSWPRVLQHQGSNHHQHDRSSIKCRRLEGPGASTSCWP